MTTHSFNEHDRVVKVVLTHPEAKLPQYAKEGDAGADVYAVSNQDSFVTSRPNGVSLVDEKRRIVEGKDGDYELAPFQTIMIDLGFKIELRPGWEMQVRSRSGMAKRGLVVANAPGTIDSGYRGPCMVLLQNTTNMYRVIKPGTRVAQFVLKRAPQAIFTQTEQLSDSERGEGGFGSTGTR